MKESGYDMFNINDPFYQDICTPFDSEDGTDMPLSDRINYILIMMILNANLIVNYLFIH